MLKYLAVGAVGFYVAKKYFGSSLEKQVRAIEKQNQEAWNTKKPQLMRVPGVNMSFFGAEAIFPAGEWKTFPSLGVW